MSELPSGWIDVAIGEIAEVIGGGTPKANDVSNFTAPGKGIAWLTPADLSGYKTKEIAYGARDLTKQGYQSCSAKLMPKGSLLFSSRAPIGYVAVAANEIATNQGFKSFVLPDGIDPSYAFYYLKSIRELADSLGTGTTFKELSGAAAKTLPFRLAPTTEQTRIAAKLDELLAQVDTLKTRIDGIPTLLKRFRQSVLAAAVSGRLTEEWRSQNALPSPSPKKFEDLLRDKTKLSYGVLKPGNADEEGVPMVRVMDIGDWGRINNSEIFRISKILSDEFKRTILEKGDILLSVMATIGRAAIVPDYLVGGNVNRALAVIKLGDDISSEFAFFQIMSPQFQAEFVEKQLGSAQRRINLSDLREFTVLLPVREEQTEIVHRVEQLFAFADQLEAKVASAKSRIDHLTQSILAKAFRGELVPQDPSDEPASVLLERIKAQRAAAAKAKRGRKASA